MREKNCIFCSKTDYELENDDAKAFFDIHPMSKGHILIVPKKHFETFFDVPTPIQNQMIELLDQSKNLLDERFHPRGYQIFSHVGRSAGQQIPHAHIHLVPVY